jgi:hypothetical protein
MTKRRGRQRRLLLDDIQENICYCKLKEEALDRPRCRIRFGTGYGLFVRQCDGRYTVQAVNCNLSHACYRFRPTQLIDIIVHPTYTACPDSLSMVPETS